MVYITNVSDGASSIARLLSLVLLIARCSLDVTRPVSDMVIQERFPLIVLIKELPDQAHPMISETAARAGLAVKLMLLTASVLA